VSPAARLAPALPTAAQWQQWDIDPAWSRTLDVPGHDGAVHRWHLLDTGAPDLADAPTAAGRPTIVCVHGNPTWAALWRTVLQRLGPRYRVIAVDQLGMGYSARPGLRRYADRVADLSDVIDALGIAGPIVVVGHDWGGAVAMGWAVSPRAAGRLAGMVLCNTGIAVPIGRKAPRLIRVAATGPVTSLVGHRTRTFVEGTFALSTTRLDATTRAALRAPYRRASSRAAIAEFVDDVPFTPDHPSAAALDAVAHALTTLDVPVLLAWGATDPVFDDDFAHDLAARLPHADLHRFARSGHLSPVEHTADVAGVIDTWLTERVVAGDRSPVAVPVAAEPATSGSGHTPTWAALEARADDHSVAYTDGATGATITFAALHTRVMGIARGLTERGVRPGDRIALLTPPGPDLLAAVYGCWRAGAVTVIADRGLGLRGLGGAVRAARVQWVIGPRQALAAARAMRWAPGARLIAVGDRASMGAECTLDQLAASTAPLPAEPAANDPAAVLYTSGATGPAKGVRYRHGQLAAQRDALRHAYGITAADRLVAAFAPFALYGPALGITSCIPDVDVTTPGALTADALAAACASIDATIVFASPAALANVVRTARPGDRHLAALRLVLSAGAPVPIATLRSMSALCPAAELHTPYGMTECLPVADVDLVTLEAVGSGRGVCVGHPVQGAVVTIAPLGFDATAPITAVGTGLTGEVLVRAPWLSDGYDQLWRTQRDARPADPVDHGVWHRSGDVGHLDDQGRLWIEGRSVHVVHTEHGPVTPVPLEVAVEALPGVARCAAVGVGPHGCQQVVVVLERPDGEAGLAEPADAVQVRAAVTQPVAAVLQVAALPVDIRHNTKIDRTALAIWAAAVLAGDRAKAPR
jgi:acyl-coenzyme A synthetase/AMP-(fatty) acid ligase/pimeloyl-ACP methyl ester carboxylesterase